MCVAHLQIVTTEQANYSKLTEDKRTMTDCRRDWSYPDISALPSLYPSYGTSSNFVPISSLSLALRFTAAKFQKSYLVTFFSRLLGVTPVEFPSVSIFFFILTMQLFNNVFCIPNWSYLCIFPAQLSIIGLLQIYKVHFYVLFKEKF